MLDADALGDECTAKRARVSRSALIREPLREHLNTFVQTRSRLAIGEVTAACPDVAGDAAAWERVASAPE